MRQRCTRLSYARSLGDTCAYIHIAERQVCNGNVDQYRIYLLAKGKVGWPRASSILLKKELYLKRKQGWKKTLGIRSKKIC